jgi:hypothetical protein
MSLLLALTGPSGTSLPPLRATYEVSYTEATGTVSTTRAAFEVSYTEATGTVSTTRAAFEVVKMEARMTR